MSVLFGDVTVIVLLPGDKDATDKIVDVTVGRLGLALRNVTGADAWELTLSDTETDCALTEVDTAVVTMGEEVIVVAIAVGEVCDTRSASSTLVSFLSSLNFVKTDPGRTTFGGHGGGDSASDPGIACITFCTDSVRFR